MAPKTAASAAGKKVQPAPFGGSKASKGAGAADKHPLFESRPRAFRIGGAIRPRVDLTRYVRWPRYIKLQRQKRVLLQRLKIPPTLNQFNLPLDRNQTSELFRLLGKYSPESRVEKRARLLKEAERRTAGEPPSANKKPVILKYGLKHVTELIESKKAKLVVIAHDVDPIELVCWLPALCRKKDVPYCIVKSKSRIGKLVHKKTTSALVVENTNKDDAPKLDALIKVFRSQFNDNVEIRRRWGGGVLGIKSRHVQERRERLLANERSKKLGR